MADDSLIFAFRWGWAGLGDFFFPCLKISSPPLLRNLFILLFLFFLFFFIDLIRGTRTETAVGYSESCRPGVRC